MRPVIPAAAIVLAAAGCGRGLAPHTVAETGPLAFARCMRAHDVTNYPDPGGGGSVRKETPQQLGVSSAHFQSAGSACARLLGNGGAPTPVALRQSWNDFRAFADCMRAHGVPGWPDPTRYPAHPERPTFALPSDVAPGSPRVRAEIDRCLPLLHGNNPQHLG